VQDLTLCKRTRARFLDRIAHPIRVNESQKCLIGGIAKGAPLIQMSKSPRRICDSFSGSRDACGPELHASFRGLNEPRIPGDPGQKQLSTVLLIVPVMRPLVIPASGLQSPPLV